MTTKRTKPRKESKTKSKATTKLKTSVGKRSNSPEQKLVTIELDGVEIETEPQKWEKPWESKSGVRKFDPDVAIELMEAEIQKYVNGQQKYHDLVQQDMEGKKFALVGVAFPTVTRMALMCGVDEKTFIVNCNARNEDGSAKNEHLLHAYNKFKDLGKVMLAEGGLAGIYDSRVVQFLGNVNYGMVPNTKVESTVEVKSMDKVYSELDAIYLSEQKRMAKQREEAEARKRQLDSEEQE